MRPRCIASNTARTLPRHAAPGTGSIGQVDSDEKTSLAGKDAISVNKPLLDDGSGVDVGSVRTFKVTNTAPPRMAIQRKMHTRQQRIVQDREIGILGPADTQRLAAAQPDSVPTFHTGLDFEHNTHHWIPIGQRSHQSRFSKYRA